MATSEPPKAEEVRAIVEKRLKAQEAGAGLRETATIEWRGQLTPIPVISMPVDLLTYNPDTHRIRAQRSHDPERDQALKTDPFGSEAQAYLHKLLMGDPAFPDRTDPAFEALRDDLAAHGQNDPGIITRSGVLINGNTRRAALEELGLADIRVGVLPGDASLEDRLSIELALQLRKDHRRDYSFMNELLAIDERVQANVPAAKIQKDFRMRSTTFERNRWILAAVRECIDRSSVTTGSGKASLRLIDFEEDKGKLEELYRTYMTLKVKSPEQADLLREQRLLAIAMNKSKTDVRLIEPDFAKKYMGAIVPSPPPVENGGGTTIPGLDIAVDGPSEDVRALKELTNQVLQARVIDRHKADVETSVATEAGSRLSTVATALDKALDQAGRSARLTKKRLAAADRISDATEDVNLALDAVVGALQTNNFDPEDIDEPLRDLSTALRKLAQSATRNVKGDESGEGVAWLKALGSMDRVG